MLSRRLIEKSFIIVLYILEVLFGLLMYMLLLIDTLPILNIEEVFRKRYYHFLKKHLEGVSEWGV